MSEVLTARQQHVFEKALELHAGLAATPSNECVSWLRRAWPEFVRAAFSHSEQRYQELAAKAPDLASDPIAPNADDLLSPLGRARDEATHTLVLAHLLDPRGAHRLGLSFLVELVERASGMKLEPADAGRARVVAERSATLSNSSSESHRGRPRLDLWIDIPSPAPRRGLHVVIENKIDAEEGERQLSDYDRVIDDRCRDGDVLRILLSPHPDRVLSSPRWRAMSYFDLAIALRRAMRGGPTQYPYAALYLATVLKEIVRVPRSDGPARRAKVAAYLDGLMEGGSS